LDNIAQDNEIHVELPEEGTYAVRGQVRKENVHENAREEELELIILEKVEKKPFGEVVVKQIIDTFEFVLGSISNTASYLRLWALSLAHAQLSEVFFNMTLGISLSDDSAMNFIVIFLLYLILACITFGILMLMDTLECFLHALRLHWVEFQGKFYMARGYRFAPASFENLGKEI